MEGYPIGLAVGIGAGIVIGIAIGRKQKPWSELTAAERRNRIIAIAAGGVLFVAGLVIFMVGLLS
jgi:hypothetical protein